MMSTTLFHGTDAERAALNLAIQRNCTCTVIIGTVGNGTAPVTCEAHKMLADERVLGHLVMVRRSIGAYAATEWPTEAGS